MATAQLSVFGNMWCLEPSLPLLFLMHYSLTLSSRFFGVIKMILLHQRDLSDPLSRFERINERLADGE